MSSQFQPYLESIRAAYAKWWERYTFTDATGKQRQAKEESPFFDFGLMVQTVKREEREREEKIERFSVLEGLRKYADQQVLLVGRPGSGKSTALARLMLEEATNPQARIPVLVELRYWQGSIDKLIHDSFIRHDLSVEQVAEALKRALILFDGVNELPSEEARSQLSAFRRNHPKLPMIFTTRDLSLGGDLGIEKKLEMQPLTEAQMREFVRSYLLSEQAEKMLGQLSDRLREFGQTPLLLWMLCEVIQQSPDSTLPRNLGEIFKVFTEAYEQSSVRKHEVAALKGDVKPLSDRRVWKKALKALAWLMMQGETPVDFRVVIDRDEAERELSRVFPNEQFSIRDILDDLLKYHLLQNRSADQIEFRHQMIQEYYAAESLLERLPELSDEVGSKVLKQDYLNYLKWTEPVALMLALVKDKALAIRVVRSALEVDWLLGARLAGEVKQEFQRKTVVMVSELDAPEWLKVEILGKTRSEVAVPLLLQSLNCEDYGMRGRTAEILGKYGFKVAIPALMQALQDEDIYVTVRAASALRNLDSEAVLPQLMQALSHGDYYKRAIAVYTLRELIPHKAVSILTQVLQDEDPLVRDSAAFALKDLATNEDSKTVQTQQSENFLVPIGANWDEKEEIRYDEACCVLPNLLALVHTSSGEDALGAILEIQAYCKYYNYKIFQAYLEAQNADRQTHPNRDRSPTTIYNFPNATEPKIFENVDRYYETPTKDPRNAVQEPCADGGDVDRYYETPTKDPPS
ncbi:MAG: HEAT repeat domain-containing protein [Plectolyngbya sp. WJT66-NPBG17]|jgi:HEAT repeat protein/energy-coupling factor transporter ATP-binding protein EcfA2|nr:HEAT repeat domain-containing protein [Plectolyngbya sp. WJT66-NPBG17]